MSVQQKLVELEDSLSTPVDTIDTQLDSKMSSMIDLIIQTQHNNAQNDKQSLPMTPNSTSNGMISFKDLTSSMKSKTTGGSTSSKDDNMNGFSSIDSAKNYQSLENLLNGYLTYL
jgi:hypothetical protein